MEVAEKGSFSIRDVFSKVKTEMFFPPVKLRLNRRLKIPVKVSNGFLNVNPSLLRDSDNPKRLLLWLLRHTLSHLHYCPYDAKNAYHLQRVAYRILGNRHLAYMAVSLFSDLQVDCIYLRGRYGETPYHLIEALRKRKPIGVERLSFAVYKEFFSDLPYKPGDDEVDILGRLLAEAIRPPKSWVSKVKAVSYVLLRAEKKGYRRMLKAPLRGLMDLAFIQLAEDAYPDSVKRVSQILGNIKDEEEAKAFCEMWIKPRMSDRNSMPLKEAKRGRVKVEDARDGYGGAARRGFKGVSEALSRRITLPTSLSRLLKRSALSRDSWWRRLWYRARAENAIITYLALSKRVKPSWAITSYPEEWYVEDDIEALDIEASLDDGPLIPEVTTVKWHMRSAGRGGEVFTSFIPSVVVVLDSSYSMTRVMTEASTAGFIAYLSAKWAGGNTAVVNFSTNHIVAEWEESDEFKELLLSTRFGELTIMPTPTIERLLREIGEPCFVVVITDGGWQNFKEALKRLERIGSKGHRVVVFYVRDWKYWKEAKALSKNPYITMHNVEDPVRDLEGLVLSETMSVYERHFKPLVSSEW